MTASRWEFFTVEELACRHCGELLMDDQFMSELVHLRARLGFPFPVTSGYRCPVHNRAVGGARDSAHLLGRAVDINVYGQRALAVVDASMDHGMTGVGVAQKGPLESRFIHLDDLEVNRPWIWSY